MHETHIPEWARKRVLERRGKAHIFSDMDPARTALVVVDLQNGFMMEGVAHSLIKGAHEIVPNVNRLAGALRQAGGLVVWIRNTATEESFKSWSIAYEKLSNPLRAKKRAESLKPGSIGHQVWAGMDVQPEDAIVDKTRFSAFIQGSSNIEAVLRARGIDTVLVTGTSTSVCCESTARDATMRNFQTVMVSDGLSAATDEEHNATLLNFYLTFGDVMTTDETVGYLQANAARSAAQA
ncbi:MAG TPA: cysteine hydrolase [Alphaproteobacteria bacterium]|jgi:ureidoacrylate peracid hydrolase